MKKILGGVALATIAVLAADPAFAAGGAVQLKAMINNTGAQITTVPTYINYVSYIIGVALAVAGVAKLKAHADNPGQTSMKDGLGRLFAATAFISLPFILTMLRTSTSTGATANLTFQDIAEMGGE